MAVSRIDIPLEDLTSRPQIEDEIQRRLAAERARLAKAARLDSMRPSRARGTRQAGAGKPHRHRDAGASVSS